MKRGAEAKRSGDSPEGAVARVVHWLFGPQPASRLAFLRIFVPLAIVGFLASRLVHADLWLSPAGFHVPDLGGDNWRQPLYLPTIPLWAAWSVAALTVLSGLSLAAGFLTRFSGALFCALTAYLTLFDRLEAFTVTKLAPVFVLALCISQAGKRFSVDAWLARRRDPERKPPSELAGGTVRFFQLFLVTMYSASGIAKARGDWLSKAVVWSQLHDDYQTAISWWMVHTVPGWGFGALQWLTLAFEIGAPLWFALKWTRKPALVVGLGMHFMIGILFGPVIWFALLMSALLIACFAPEAWLAKLLPSG